MPYLPNPTPRRKYCHTHGIEYDGYLCPQCKERMEREELERLTKKAEKAEQNRKFQKLLDDAFNPKPMTEHPQPKLQSQPKQQPLGSLHMLPKRHSASALGGFIVLLFILFVIGLVGIGIYSAYSTYHDRVFSWVKQESSIIIDKATEVKDKVVSSIPNDTDKASPVIQPTTPPPLITIPNQITTPIIPTTPPDTSVETYSQMFNDYRERNGRNPLIFTDDLNRIATLRLNELYTNYSHYSAGRYNIHLAENINRISFGSLSNVDTFNSWRNSPGHNANMLDFGYKYTGYAAGNGYAVQVFTEWTTINGEPQLPPGYYWP